jgi:hypothetical protein
MIISVPYKNGDVVSLKLSNGEEIIAKLISEDAGRISVERPVVLQMGPKGAPALMPYFMTVSPNATRTVKLNANLVVAIASTDKPLADQYLAAMTGIQPVGAGVLP